MTYKFNYAPEWQEFREDYFSTSVGEAMTVYLPGYIDLNSDDSHSISLLENLDFAEYSYDCLCVLFYPSS